MSQPKDYDSTLARMAGNIAAGLAGNTRFNLDAPPNIATIARQSVTLAQAIIELCKQKQPDPKA